MNCKWTVRSERSPDEYPDIVEPFGNGSEDRSYLAQLVAANTGLAGPEAENRWRDRKGSGRDNQISPLAFSVAARLCCWVLSSHGQRRV